MNAPRPTLALLTLLGVSACAPPSSVAMDADRSPDAAADAASDGAQDAAPDSGSVSALTAILAPIRERHRLPALAALVADDRSTIDNAVVGQRSIDDPTLATTSDKWHLGSCTKAMTATLFARLVERGAMQWESTLEAAFPETATMIDATLRPATLEQLFQHRAGLPEQIPNALWSALWMDGDVVEQRRTFAAAILARPAAATPGARYLYANAGYIVAGAAIERAIGRSWEESMRQEIFAPLAMTSCGFGAPATPERFDQPWGHESAGDTITSVSPGPAADNPRASGPSGTVHCSLEDWARFAQVHLRGARGAPDERYLQPATFARMHTAPMGGAYALGWNAVERPWAGGRALAHAGSNTMFLATVWIAPARNRVLMVATNIANPAAEMATQEALLAMIAAFVPGA